MRNKATIKFVCKNQGLKRLFWGIEFFKRLYWNRSFSVIFISPLFKIKDYGGKMMKAKEAKGTVVWLPGDLVDLVDKLKCERMDPTRSDTVRFLILKALAELSYLREETKKALG